MGWAAIIAGILQILGPIFSEWIRKWLEERLNRAARELGETGSAAALFDRAIADQRRGPKRMLLKRLRAMTAGGVFAATEADIEELRDLAPALENE